MTHPRKQIRDYVMTQLRTIAGLNVDSQTLENVAQSTLPEARVMILSEAAVQSTQNPAKFMTEGEMVIQVRETGTLSVDELDDLAEQIIPLMLADTSYGGLCKISNYRGYQLDLNENTNDTAIQLAFSFRYETDFT